MLNAMSTAFAIYDGCWTHLYIPVVVRATGGPSANVNEEPSCAKARSRMDVNIKIMARDNPERKDQVKKSGLRFSYLGQMVVTVVKVVEVGVEG